jgi:hypothetical protein
MQFKGTKGDWKAVSLEATGFHTKRNEIQFGNDGECIAEFVHNTHDAKLIAAAPDLLEALQNLIKQVEEDYVMMKDINKAREAINKALTINK